MPNMDDNEIEATLLSVEAELGVMLTVHDFGGIFHDANGRSLLAPGRASHRRNPLCVAPDRERCMAHCLEEVRRRCATEGRAVTTSCWTGLTEVVVPLRRGAAQLGTLSAGCWRGAHADDSPPRVYARSAELAEAWRALTPLSPTRSAQLGRILAAVADGLLASLERIQRMEPEPGNRRMEIRRFVAMHADHDLHTRDLARRLHLSPSRAGHLVTELFGVPFAILLQRERLQRARTLLASTDFRVKEIALRCGFGDEFQFNRIFRKAEGLSPGHYRRRHLR